MANNKTKKTSPRQALLVLGMHRSGTSAISGMMALLGAHAPRSLMEPTKDNPRGYWESVEVVKANERILSSAGSRWNDWGEFNPDWFASAVAEQQRASLVDVIQKEYGTAPLFLIKDPRICRFLPLWLDALEEVGVEPRIVIPVRHPLAVARSLEVRDHFGRNRSLLLWLRHVLDAEASSRHLPRTFVSYDSALDDWQTAARRIAEDLAIAWPKRSDDTDLKISDFLTARLRVNSQAEDAIAGDSEMDGWVRQTYDALQQACQAQLEPESLYNLDRIRREFNRSSAIYGPVVREHEKRVEALYADVKARLAESFEKSQAQGELLAGAETKLSETLLALEEQRQAAGKLRERLDAEEHSKVEQKVMEEQIASTAAAFERAMEVALAEQAGRFAEQQERFGKKEQGHREALERLRASEGEVLKLREGAERQRGEAAKRYEMALAAHSNQLVERDEEVALLSKKISEMAAERERATAEHISLQENMQAQLSNREAAVKRLTEELSQQSQKLSDMAAERDLAATAQQAALQNLQAQLSAKEEAVRKLSEESSQLRQKNTEMVAERKHVGTEHQIAMQLLQGQLSNREETIEKLAVELSQLKSGIETQSIELHRALTAAETSAKVRFRETAKLTEMLFQSEEAAQAQASRAAEFAELLAVKEKSVVGLERRITLLDYRMAVTRSTLLRRTDAWQHQAQIYAQALHQIVSSRAWRLLSHLQKVELPSIKEPGMEADVDSQVLTLRASELFDANWYLENHPDAANSGMEPERHYLQIGAMEGYNPGPDFDSVAYLREYPDVLDAAVNPLLHYLEYGKIEARTVAPVERDA